jgi:hypothetical protein
LDAATGSDLQLFPHEVMLVSGGMILEHSKNAVSTLFIEGSCLKTEGVKKCVGAATLDRVKLRTLYQFCAKATPSRRRSDGKRSHVQPSRPDISDQTA